MAKERKAYAPFSLTSEAGVAQTPVEGYIDVRQEIYPIVSTGTINENGKWTGVKASDTEFFAITTHLQVPDSGTVLAPDTGSVNFIDMTGFNDIFIAVKPSNGGAVAISACMGPDTERFANLEPVDAAVSLRGNIAGQNSFSSVLVDSSESLTANKWNIFSIKGNLKGQKLVNFKLTNNSGGISDIEIAFMRIV